MLRDKDDSMKYQLSLIWSLVCLQFPYHILCVYTFLLVLHDVSLPLVDLSWCYNLHFILHMFIIPFSPPYIYNFLLFLPVFTNSLWYSVIYMFTISLWSSIAYSVMTSCVGNNNWDDVMGMTKWLDNVS